MGHFVYEASATRYEINVVKIENESSMYSDYFLISLANFGECFTVKHLDDIAEEIFNSSSLFSSTDAINVQNGISEHFENVSQVRFDSTKRQVVKVDATLSL